MSEQKENVLETAILANGCFWCTEAVFQSLKGVSKVKQGFVASINENYTFSEAIVIEFYSEIISLETLIEIHLHTHKSTSNHSMRDKYRSAVYTFSKKQSKEANDIISRFQPVFNNAIITRVYPFSQFKASRESIQNYYQKNPEKPFCKRFINPKLKLLLEKFNNQVKTDFTISN